MKYDCIIIGGGASALMLASRLDITGSPGGGLILEKTGRPGAKLLMSGGGRCNITHGGRISEFVDCYGSAGRHIRTCLYRHSNMELASWLEENGIPLADGNGCRVTSQDILSAGRVFPASMKSADVRDLLLDRSASNGWKILTDTEVRDVKDNGTEGWSTETSRGYFTSDNLVIASGGITYPETGSDGSVFNIAAKLGIRVSPLRSALAQIYVDNYPYRDLSGISVADVSVTISGGNGSDAAGTMRGSGKKRVRMTGDLLFTHTGFSGPVILNISRYAAPGCRLSISYGCSLEELPRRMQRVLEDRSRGPSGDIRTTVLAALLESDGFTVSSVDGKGMVTAGGIELDEIDMKTMQLKRFPGLFAIGEAIDADGITGGYNLQMCWSTASAAADAISSPLNAPAT